MQPTAMPASTAWELSPLRSVSPGLRAVPVLPKSVGVRFLKMFGRQRRGSLLVEIVSMVLVIGYLDFLSGRDITLFLLYAVPIFLAAWCVNRAWGLGCAVLCGVAWWAANFQVHTFATDWGYSAAAVSRLGYFVFVAIGGAALRAQRNADRARMEALEQNSALKQEILRISEREQQRIGQELHDGLCQYLAAIACAAKCLRDDLEERTLPEASAALEIERLLNDAVRQTRSLARGIFPVQMDEAGLPAALEELVATTNHLMSAAVSFETHGEIRVTNPETAMHLYRIAQEALNNALKHGHARHIAIALYGNDERLRLVVSDDGQGFPTREQWHAGMGMKTMQYRAREIGAELGIGTTGAGSTVTCTVPTEATLN
jgi:signal transduction histidine kinase